MFCLELLKSPGISPRMLHYFLPTGHWKTADLKTTWHFFLLSWETQVSILKGKVVAAVLYGIGTELALGASVLWGHPDRVWVGWTHLNGSSLFPAFLCTA